MSYTKVKNIIQNSAWDSFPAQELWFRESDISFWAYDKCEKKVFITTGAYSDKLTYRTSEVVCEDVDEFINNFIDKKTEEGYECFASQLIV
jgi:hypothetical protein